MRLSQIGPLLELGEEKGQYLTDMRDSWPWFENKHPAILFPLDGDFKGVVVSFWTAGNPSSFSSSER